MGQWAAFALSVIGAYLLGTTAWTIWLYRHSKHAAHVPPVAAGLALVLVTDLVRVWLLQIPPWAVAVKGVGYLFIIYGLRMLLAGARARMNESKGGGDAR